MSTEPRKVFHLSDYKPTDFVLTNVDLTFRLNPEQTEVSATLKLHRRDGVATDAPLVLDGDDLSLRGLALNGDQLADSQYTVTPDLLTVKDLPSSDSFELQIETVINPSSNTQLMGLYRTQDVYCTQCEAEGFRRITYFPDRPDVLAPYSTRIEAEKSSTPLLLSNGNPAENGDLPDGWHYAVWDDPHPKPSYLFALVAGDLGVVEDWFTTSSGRKVKLEIFVEHGKEARAAYAMDTLKRSMRWDEERFGREYDLDIFMIVAVSDFNMGAMENKGLNVFNDKYVLADPDTATDADYANIEAIIAHEYFHNWTGNRITCRDWFQLCLKEGLTVYRDHEFSSDERSRPVKRIAEVRTLKAHQFPEDSGPLAHNVRPEKYSEINNFYTATVYEKGSEVVRMIATILGPETFKAGMDLYFDRHDGDAATIEDFIACFAEVSGRDFDQFFRWYQQAGTPAVTVSTDWQPASGTFSVSLEQSLAPTPGQPKKKLAHIPLKFGLVGKDGHDTDLGNQDDVIHLTERKQKLSFAGLEARPALSLNRGFSAPVTIHYDQSATDLAHLARHDSDPFSRWQAITTLATRALVGAAEARRNNTKASDATELLDAIVATTSDETLEPAFRAQVLQLPGEADIAREIGSNIDPDAIHLGRQDVLTRVAQAGQACFETVFAATRTEGSFDPDAASAGLRALNNQCLSFLAYGDRSPKRVIEAYHGADNMTVRAHALIHIAHNHAEDADVRSVLAAFEERYRDDPLVIDKWLTIQATAPGSQALETVHKLMNGSHFDRSNPNRVRALIGAFASGNPTGFNRADGRGYAFLAEEILALDKINAQVAARILTAMRSWSSLEPVRAGHAKQALQRIAASENLSADVRDIVDRSLGKSG